MKRLMLVDGNALFHRAYHATPPLTTPKGELINAVFGFTNILLNAISAEHPEYICVCWDTKAPTFRHQEFIAYKATRGPTDEALSSQYPHVFEICKVFNIPEFREAGFEADDLIGTLARQAYEQFPELEIIIMTGDRDIMQMINDRIKVMMPRKTLTDVALYGEAEFRDKFGFDPIQIIDYKALAGDASDNIPGVAGVGDVTATKLIKQFGSMEQIYHDQNIQTLPERLQGLLINGAESAILSKKLATIDTHSPVELDLEKCQTHDFSKAEVLRLFEEFDFKSLIKRLNLGSLGEAKILNGESVAVEDKSADQPEKIVELDRKAQIVLNKMSEFGVLIDQVFLEQFGSELKVNLSQLEHDIYQSIGHEFNINSPKQLGEILYDELKLPVLKKTKTSRSTDEETLQELADLHPVVEMLLSYRTNFKLLSTYIDALPKYCDENSRIHSTFIVDGAATGRISSKDPNLQNIPIRGELGSKMRKVFIAPKGKLLIRADYSQIELRILAHISGDPNLINAFKENLDIHASTAAKIFGVEIDSVDKTQRGVGKTMNFATLYGQGPRALSKQLKVDYATAKGYIKAYFDQFPKVRVYLDETIKKAHEQGFVSTLWGRKRYFPEFKMQNRFVIAAAERMAANMPTQGTQADMIKQAMVDIDELHIDPEKLKLILQIHDELLFEASPEFTDQATEIIHQKMENALKLDVPILVEIKVGKNWGEME